MRSVCSWGVLLLLLVGLSCDNAAVLTAEQETYDLSIRIGNATAMTFDVWYLSEDTDGDGVGDQPPYLWCERNTTTSIAPLSVPWPYAIEIGVIRAGSTEIQPLSSQEALQPSADLNAAAYANNIPSGSPVNKGPVTQDGRNFIFTNPGRTVTSLLEEVMTATYNPLAEILNAGVGEGLCSTGHPGPARIDGTPQPYPITLNAGDTLIVNASPALSSISGSGLADLLIQNPSVILASLRLNGQELDDFVQGEISGESVSFTFTSR